MDYIIYNAADGLGGINKLAKQGWNLSTAPATTHGLKYLEPGDIVLEREKIDLSPAPNNVIGEGDEYVLGESHIWLTVRDKTVRVDHHSVRIYDLDKEDETPLSEIHFCDLS